VGGGEIHEIERVEVEAIGRHTRSGAAILLPSRRQHE
jgi:hypothetical protein